MGTGTIRWLICYVMGFLSSISGERNHASVHTKVTTPRFTFPSMSMPIWKTRLITSRPGVNTFKSIWIWISILWNFMNMITNTLWTKVFEYKYFWKCIRIHLRIQYEYYLLTIDGKISTPSFPPPQFSWLENFLMGTFPDGNFSVSRFIVIRG